MRRGKVSALGMLALGMLAPALAARGARKIAGKGYQRIADREPPRNPASRETDWVEALVWTALVGAVGGVARLLVRRALSETEIPSDGDDLDHERERLDLG